MRKIILLAACLMLMLSGCAAHNTADTNAGVTDSSAEITSSVTESGKTAESTESAEKEESAASDETAASSSATSSSAADTTSKAVSSAQSQSTQSTAPPPVTTPSTAESSTVPTPPTPKSDFEKPYNTAAIIAYAKSYGYEIGVGWDESLTKDNCPWEAPINASSFPTEEKLKQAICSGVDRVKKVAQKNGGVWAESPTFKLYLQPDGSDDFELFFLMG
jgi:hypothetical protein